MKTKQTKPSFFSYLLAISSRRTKWSLGLGIAAVSVSFALAQVQQLWTADEIIQNTSLRIPAEEIVRYPANLSPKDAEWAKFGITHSRELEQLGEKIKTPQERAKEDWTRLAIVDPAAYQAALERAGLRAVPTAEQQAAHSAAIQGILNPHASAQVAEAQKNSAQKRREDIIKQAILNPRAFNEQVARLKTAEHLEQEALAREAILRPEAFKERLSR